MDDLDRRLIALLRIDGRLPVASLAAALGTSRATVRSRMDRLIKDQIIIGFSVILKQDLENPGVQAITLIEVSGQAADRVSQKLRGFPEVRKIHTTNGKWDLILDIETGTLGQFDQLLRKIRLVAGVTNSETNIFLGTI